MKFKIILYFWIIVTCYAKGGKLLKNDFFVNFLEFLCKWLSSFQLKKIDRSLNSSASLFLLSE